MRNKKIFAGAKIRHLREQGNLTQKQLAARLDLSTSYINQIENNQRPLTAPLMLALAQKFNFDLADLMSDSSGRLLADLREVLADPVFGDTTPGAIEMQSLAANSPDFARALIALYGAYAKSQEKLAGIDAAITSIGDPLVQTPYEEVRDFFHYSNNYIDPLDRAAEELASELGGSANPARRLEHLSTYLEDTHEVTLSDTPAQNVEILRAYDRRTRTLALNPRLPMSSRFFQIACQLAEMEQTTLISQILKDADFKLEESRQICHIGLTNYFAGALQMPYGKFLNTAAELAHDLQEVGRVFGASLEQVAHRLSTLQREGARGVPFFFARVDAAGTITKRHSATPLQFARFGSACPLWNVHRAFEAGGQITRQLAQTPEGNRYLCLAWSKESRFGGFNSPQRRYAYALGCEIDHAKNLVYADGLSLELNSAYDPIGISCRICTRRHCPQRSMPPIAGTIQVLPDQRSLIPYEIV